MARSVSDRPQAVAAPPEFLARVAAVFMSASTASMAIDPNLGRGQQALSGGGGLGAGGHGAQRRAEGARTAEGLAVARQGQCRARRGATPEGGVGRAAAEYARCQLNCHGIK